MTIENMRRLIDRVWDRYNNAPKPPKNWRRDFDNAKVYDLNGNEMKLVEHTSHGLYFTVEREA